MGVKRVAKSARAAEDDVFGFSPKKKGEKHTRVAAVDRSRWRHGIIEPSACRWQPPALRSVGEVFRGGGSGVGRARGAVGGRRAGGSCSRRDATYLLVAAAGLGDVALRALGLEDLRACESRHSRWERRVSWRTTGGDARVGRAREAMRRAFARVSTYPWRRHRREPQRRKPCFSACVRRAMPRTLTATEDGSHQDIFTGWEPPETRST